MDVPLHRIETTTRKRYRVQPTAPAVLALGSALAVLTSSLVDAAAKRAARRRASGAVGDAMGGTGDAACEGAGDGENDGEQDAMIQACDVLGARAALEARMRSLASTVTPAMLEADWFVVRVIGNGSCLFISLRLAWEVYAALKLARAHLDAVERGEAADAPPPCPCLDGYSDAVQREGEIVRTTIVEWFRKGLDTELPGGERTRAHDEDGCVARPVVRGDLIANYLVGEYRQSVPDVTRAQVAEAERGQDAAAAEAERGQDAAAAEAARAKYAQRMRHITGYLTQMARTMWGSLPEWQAWAYLIRVAFAAYIPDPRDPRRVIPTCAVVPPLTARVTALTAPVPADILELTSDTRDISATKSANEAAAEVEAGAGEGAGEGTDGGAGESEGEGAGESEGEAEHAPADGAEDGTDSDDDEAEYLPTPSPSSPSPLERSDDEDERLTSSGSDTDAGEEPFAGRLLHKGQHYAVLLTAREFWTLWAVHGDALCGGGGGVPWIVPLHEYIEQHML